MTQGKIELNLGALSFSGEGEQPWLAEQLDKILKAAPEIASIQPRPVPTDFVAIPVVAEAFTETLASYIREKGGEDNQVQRFLVTADWLRRRGEKKLTTSAASKALKNNHQKRLGNPSDCLNQNVSKGYCEKTSDGGFFITPDGLRILGNTK